MISWLLDICIILVGNIKKSPGKCFSQSIFSVLMICFKIKAFVGFNEMKIIPYFKTFLPNLVTDFQLCQSIVTILHNQYKRNFAICFEAIFQAVTSCDPPLNEWIFIIPILYQLNEECESSEPLATLAWNHYKTNQG